MESRFIRPADDYIDVIQLNDGGEWDFKKMQEAKGRSWHSRPYEYKFAWNALNALSEKNQGAVVLDLGCGTEHPGYVYLRANQNLGEIHALDLEERLLTNGMDACGVTKHVGDAANLPFDDASFDAVVSISAIEHMPEWKKVFAEVFRVLKVGGEAIFTIDISDTPELTLKHYVDGKTPEDYFMVLQELGFESLGDVDFSWENAVDLINSEFSQHENESEMLEGQHRALKAFRFHLKKV